MRVKIFYQAMPVKGSDSALGKLLQFDPSSTDMEELLAKIARKLGVTDTNNDQPLSSQFQLTLEGQAEIDNVEDIKEDDSLVLVPIQGVNNSQPVPPQPVAPSQPSATAAAATARLASSGKENTRNQQDGDGKVEDATEFMKEQRAADRKKRQEVETIELLSSDDSEEDDDDDDEDDDDESVSIQDGPDALDGLFSDSDDDDDDDDPDYDDEEERKTAARVSRSNRKASLKETQQKESPLEVLMDAKDIPCAPGSGMPITKTDLEETSTLQDGAGRPNAKKAIKDRIIKLLNMGFHNQSNENEAKNAMKLASKLMLRHNLSQALLLKEQETKNKEDEATLGMAKLRIVNRKTREPPQYARWMSRLASPIMKTFGVKRFNSKPCTVTFYGRYNQSQLAAYAFKVVAERIAQMMAEHIPEKAKPGEKAVCTRSSRLSYALGIIEGLEKAVDRQREADRQQYARKLERAQEAVKTGKPYEESDNEEDLGTVYDADDDDDKEGTGFMFAANTEPAASVAPTAAAFSSPATPGAENGQGYGDDYKPKATEIVRDLQMTLALVDDVQNEARVEKEAEEALKQKGIKLSKGRKRKPILKWNRLSFAKGKEDSKKIDLRRRAIRNETKVKKEQH